MVTEERAKHLFQSGFHLFQWSREWDRIVDAERASQALELQVTGLGALAEVYGSDYPRRAHDQISIALLAQMIVAQKRAEESGFKSPIGLLAKALIEAVETGFDELFPKYFKLIGVYLEYNQTLSAPIFRRYARFVANAVAHAGFVVNYREGRSGLYPAVCYDLACVFASKGDPGDLSLVRAQLLFYLRCISTAQETAWYRQYAILDGANACFHLNRLDNGSRHSKTGLAILDDLQRSQGISNTCKLAALAQAAKLINQQCVNSREICALEDFQTTLKQIRALLSELSLGDLELLQYAEEVVHEVYLQSSQNEALLTYLDILSWHIAHLAADDKAGLGFLLGKRAEALHELYESDHDGDTLMTAMISMTEGMHLVAGAKDQYLNMGLRLRAMLRSYEDRGGDIFKLDATIFNVAFGEELERYSLESAMGRLRESIETKGPVPFRSFTGWSLEAAETYQTLSDEELRNEVAQLTEQVAKNAVSSPQYVKMLFRLARAKDETYQRSLLFADLREAVGRYEESLRYASVSQFRHAYLLTALSYGQLLYARGHVERAMALFSDARKAAITMPGFTRDELAEESELLTQDRFPELIPLLASRGELSDAFEMAQLAKRPTLRHVRPGILFDLSGVGKEQPASSESWKALCDRRRVIGESIKKLRLIDPKAHEERQVLRSELLRQHLAEEETLEHLGSLLGGHPGILRLNRKGLINLDELLRFLLQFKIVAVEYVRHADGWSAFVLDEGGIQYFALPGLTADLLRDVTTWVDGMSKWDGRNLEESRKVLSKLYQAAIAPLSKVIERNAQIVFAPQADLWRTPLQLAINPSSNRYLIDDYPISFVDNLTDLWCRFLSMAANRDQEDEENRSALLSIAYPGHTDSPGYLSMAINESKGLCALFERASALHGGEATIGAFFEKAKGAAIVHIACHGVLGATSMDDGLVLADGVLSARHIQESIDLLEAKLVILASCKSGQGTITGEQGLNWMMPTGVRRNIQSVARAFLSTGAENAIASMWETSDLLSQRIVQELGSQITKRLDVSSAMRNAILKVRDDPNFALLAHPFYWGGFQVHGIGVMEALA